MARQKDNTALIVIIAILVIAIALMIYFNGDRLDNIGNKKLCNLTICNLGFIYHEPTATEISNINRYESFIININVKKTGLDKQINNSVFLYYYQNPNFASDFVGADIGYDWDTIKLHEEWFLHDSNNNRIHPNESTRIYAMDTTNSAWQDFFVSSTRKIFVENPDYDGLFVDDVRPYDNWYNSYHVWHGYTSIPVPFWTREQYESGVKSLTTKLKIALPGKKIIINSHIASEFMGFADGAMDEGFAHPLEYSGTKYLNETEWLNDINKLADSINEDKIITLLVGYSGVQLSSIDEEKLKSFTIASYLLARRDDSAVFVFWQGNNWNPIISLPIINVDLGKPIGDYYKEQNVYKRKYEKGTVIVNPSNVDIITGTSIYKAHSGTILFTT